MAEKGKRRIRVESNGRIAKVRDDEWNELELESYSTGELVATIGKESIVVPNGAVYELRDWLNRRYP